MSQYAAPWNVSTPVKDKKVPVVPVVEETPVVEEVQVVTQYVPKKPAKKQELTLDQ